MGKSNEMRFILRKYPYPGTILSDKEVSEYSIYHRYLTVHEMARRMHDVCAFLHIHKEGSELNSIENWVEEIYRMVRSRRQGFGVFQVGIFRVEQIKNAFDGLAFTIWADVGAVIDDRLWEDDEEDQRPRPEKSVT